jgi:hypothetical protein
MSEEELLERVADDALAAREAEFYLPVHMDLHTMMCVVGALQLSLRHPQNTGPSAKVVRELIAGIIARVETEGYKATAEMMRLGDDPANDLTV